MPWKTDIVLMLRSLIGDLDRTKYTDERLKQVIVVGAYNVINDAEFYYTYTVDVGCVSISPDPVSNGNTDFVVLTLYKSACILIGSEVKTESANAISIKDGPSAIDLRGVSGSLSNLHNKLCQKYDDLLDEYKSESAGGFDSDGNPVGRGYGGASILSPYSPGSFSLNANNYDNRGFNFY
jgi:hypothetical protein